MVMRVRSGWGWLAAVGLLAAPEALAGEPGVYWEQSVEMEMAGFSMPAVKQKVCLPTRAWTEPPKSGQDDGKCKTTDVTNDGRRMTWKMVCAGGDTGEGEMVYAGDGFEGKMTTRSSGGEARMKMRGRKLGGDCDAGEMKAAAAAAEKQVKEGQARAAEATAKACDEAVQKMSVMAFAGPYAFCKDPAKKAEFCARFPTRGGFAAVDKPGTSQLKDASELCGKDPEAIRSALCAPALKEESLAFVGTHCPEERRVLAQRECAGRDYTTVDKKYAGFCNTYAREMLERGGGSKTPQKVEKKAQDEAVEKGKKAVKGLFGL